MPDPDSPFLHSAFNEVKAMKLDSVQLAAQEQFARQSRNYGRSHILADVSDNFVKGAATLIAEVKRIGSFS